MTCVVVYSHQNKSLEERKFASHAAVARRLNPDQTLTIQETSGRWQGWFRVIGISKDGKQYWISRPHTEY